MLSRLLRRLLLRYLEEAFDTGRLRFGGTLSPLTERRAFVAQLAPARETEWVVYAKPPFGGPQQVLGYVGRYTHRVAISDDRLLDVEAGHVRFRYRNSPTEPPSVATATLTAAERCIPPADHPSPRRLGRKLPAEHAFRKRLVDQTISTSTPGKATSAISLVLCQREMRCAVCGYPNWHTPNK